VGTRGEDFKKADLLEFEGTEAFSNGEYDRAFDACAEAARIFNKLRSERPDDEEIKYRFASAVNNTGSAILELAIKDAVRNRVWDVARMELARSAIIEAMSLFAELWAKNPRRPAFGNDFAATLSNLGYLISFSNKPEAAEKFFLESLRVRDDVRSRFPYDSKAVDGWRRTAEHLAALYEKLGYPTKAAHARG
jgi:hypothetical protein